ncbi:MAG: hypothetical protein ACK40X_06270, partial [Armatimonadota bacterium]
RDAEKFSASEMRSTRGTETKQPKDTEEIRGKISSLTVNCRRNDFCSVGALSPTAVKNCRRLQVAMLP